MIAHANHHLVASLKFFSQAASLMVICVGCLVLSGWMFDIEVLKKVLPSLVAMNPTTALSFILTGASLWLLQMETAGQRTRRIAKALAFIAAVVGLLKLSQIVFGWQFGIDQLLFREKLEADVIAVPNRMAPNTEVNFLLVGCALLFLDVETKRGRRPAQFLALAVTLIAMLTLIGYSYRVSSLQGIASFIPMALHTAAAFIVLSAGILFARPEHGLMLSVVRNSVSGAMLRRMLIVIIGIPLALGWFSLAGYRAGFYDAAFGFSVFVVMIVNLFTVVIWGNAVLLDQQESERLRAEEAIRKSEQYRDFFKLANDAILVFDPEGEIVLDVNDKACKVYGIEREAFIGKSLKDMSQDAQRGEQQLATLLAEGTYQEFETVHFRSDGAPINLLINGSIIEYQGRRAVLSINRDITARKRAEFERDAERQLLDTLIDQLPVGILFRDVTGRHTRVNQTVASIIGIERSQLSNMSIDEVIRLA